MYSSAGVVQATPAFIEQHSLEDTMVRPMGLLKTATALLTIMGSLTLAPQVVVAADASIIEEGKKLAFDRKKGNCLACHQITGGELAGNIGPPLVAMQTRFPDKTKLRTQIWDATKNNKSTMMPPFGRHNILNDSEIDKVVEFVYSL